MNSYDSRLDKKGLIIVVLCIVILLTSFGTMGFFIIKHEKSKNEPITIKMDELQSSFSMSSHVPRGSHIMTEEEFESAKNSMTFSTYEEYCSAVQAQFASTVPTVSADEINMKIYDYCDQYFKVYWGAERVSPLFPMALSNIETQGRADFSITYCALFPSRYVDINQIDTFDVTSVYQNDSVRKALTNDYSTRDRGCLQMNPSYGCNNEYLNSLMSGTEKDKLAGIDTSADSGWVSGASSKPGDRFYLPDVLMRLQAAMEENIQNFVTKDYEPQTDMQLIAMMAISHNSGGSVFAYKNHSKKVGNWYSGQQAYDYCEKIGRTEFVDVIASYAATHDSMYISYKEAIKLYEDFYDEDPTGFCSSKVNAGYPIMAIYSYIKLVTAYTS